MVIVVGVLDASDAVSIFSATVDVLSAGVALANVFLDCCAVVLLDFDLTAVLAGLVAAGVVVVAVDVVVVVVVPVKNDTAVDIIARATV